MAIKEGDKIPNVKVKATDMTDITTDALFSGKKVVLYPDELKSGNIIYPYAAAKN